MNLRANSSKGCVKYDTEWGYLYNNDYEICKSKINVQNHVSIGIFVNCM